MERDDEEYATYSEVEHVLNRSQMYVGRRETVRCQGPTLRRDGKGLVPSEYDVTVSPIVEKLLDEALVNSVDATLQDDTVTKISVGFDAATGRITVQNDGRGIPVKPMSETNGELVPSVIFGQLRSSSKFDDSKESLTGGMNGYGIKLCNIWSDPAAGFTVRTLHPETKREFSQTWTDHMRSTTGPKTKATQNKRGWVEVSFVPDYARLGIELPLSDAVLCMLRARVYDACACTHGGVRVHLDGEPIPLKGAAQFAAATFGARPLAHDTVSSGGVDRLEVYLADGAAHRSMWFVNGLRTRGGGTLMDYVVRKVTEILTAKARERSKNQAVSVRPSLVKENVGFVVVARIPNARFTSQEKDVLETPASKFAFTWTPSASFVTALGKSQVIEQALRAHASTDERKTKSAVRRVSQPSKLDPALYAGRKGKRCTLILTEGDSAKATVVAAMDVLGRECYGIFPLRGKPISGYNPKIFENEEVKAVLSILQIDPFKKTWTAAEIDALPYNDGVLVVADADHDGSHICGLVLCLMHRLVPDIMRQRPRFVRKFASPILQAVVGANTHSFLTEQDYRRWREQQAAATLARARVDYFKGLGTWSSADARRFFGQFREHTLALSMRGEECETALKLFFDPSQADERKVLLTDRDLTTLALDYSNEACSISEFLHNEQIHFSAEDVVRSIARLDSFKPGARKTLWAFRKRGYHNRVKVAQAGAGVAEISQYHHGETSLIETICNLAQTHVGTNNLNLLIPKGQFGSRANKRSVHAAARYIFCRLSPLFDLICPKADDPVLVHDVVDGHTVEPVQYAPVIAMPLINGAFGIGTGFSTSVPNYKPQDVVCATKAFLHGGEPSLRAVALRPWYRGFYGEVVDVPGKEGVYELRGKYELRSQSGAPGATADTVHILELPPGKWTSDYRDHLKKTFVDTQIAIKPPIDRSTEHSVHIEIVCDATALANCRGKLDAMLALTSVERTTNMWLWNVEGKLQKFETPHDIIVACAAHRLKVYDARREHQIRDIERHIRILENKERFIREEREGTIQTRVPDEDAIVAQLREGAYHSTTEGDDGFDYLLDLKIRQKTDAAMARLTDDAARRRAELDELRRTTAKDMWLAEICALEARMLSVGLVRDEVDEAAPKRAREGGGESAAHAKKARAGESTSM